MIAWFEERRMILDGKAGATRRREQALAGRYRFSHALVRETLYAELSAAEQVPLGRHLSRTIETGVYCVYRPDDPEEWDVTLG